MKNSDRKKHRKFLLSLFVAFAVVTTGTAAYAGATGQMPRVLQTIANVFSPSAGNSAKQNIADLQVSDGNEPVSQIDPSEINSTNTIDHSSSSESSIDPDAPVTSEDQSVNTGTTSGAEVNPIPITTSSDTTSTSSSPASRPTSSAPVSSKPSSSAPTSSAPTSSEPVSSSSDSGGKSTGGGGSSKSTPITSVTLDKTELTLNKGDSSESLLATISPANTTGSKTLTWESKNPAIATIDSTGKVTAVGAGTTQVGVSTSNGKTASCNVTVLVPPNTVKIDSDNFSLDKGSGKTLTATVGPEDCTDKSVVWATSNSDVISVDSEGKVTAENIGTATITATTADGKFTASCDVTGVIPIASLTLNQSELSMIKGTEQTLTATIDPPDTTDEKTITWASTKPAIATVDSTGKISAVARGTTVISAQVGSHVAECTVTVTVPASGIVLNKPDTTIAKGTEELLKATVFPEDTTDTVVEWTSSDASVATVDSTGNVTAVSVGSAVITATSHDGGFTAQCNVTVVVPVIGITLDRTDLHLIKGGGDTLTATLTPVDATDQAVTWSTSNPFVATVDDSGHITTIGGGTATISVKTHDGGFTASCSVTVTVPVSGIALDKTTLTLVKGTNHKLTATIAPEDATDKNVLWSSSDSNVCTVDDTGALTALNTGTSVITATSEDGGFTAQCTITVVIPVTGVSLDKSELHLIKGSSDTLTATITPADATDQAVTWESSNTSVATVDATGHVTAFGGGTATITLKTHDGGFEASCSVAVTVPVSGITLDKTALTLIKGTNGNLTATISPADATDKNVLWSTSNSNVCTVDSSGYLTALNAGTAVITAKSEDGGFTAQSTITVVIPVTGVSLDKADLHLIKGSSNTLTAAITPVDATDQAVVWASSDTSVATVDSAGHITAVGGGTATISVKTHDGDYTTNCAVTVTVPVTGITLDKSSMFLSQGASNNLTATIAPADASDKGVSWSSSDPSIVTVDSNGVVTAVGSGSATITATTHDGGFISTCTATTVITWTPSFSVENTSNTNTVLKNTDVYTSNAVFNGDSGHGVAHALYNFNQPMKLKAGSTLKLLSGYRNYTKVTIILNGTTSVEESPQNNDQSGTATNTRTFNYVVPSDITVTSIELQTYADTGKNYATPYNYTALFITPLNEKTFVLNNSGTSEGQDASNWYYFDAPSLSDDKYTYADLYTDTVYFRSGTSRKAYFHFTRPRAIDHIQIGPASNYRTTVTVGVQDVYKNSRYNCADKYTTSSASFVTYSASDMTSVDWNNITDFTISCDNSNESRSYPVIIYFTDGSTLTLGQNTYHGVIIG